jgi:hypothetical protein
MDAIGLLVLLLLVLVVVGRCYNLLLAQAPLVLIHFLSASFHQFSSNWAAAAMDEALTGIYNKMDFAAGLD